MKLSLVIAREKKITYVTRLLYKKRNPGKYVEGYIPMSYIYNWVQ